jgi:hypothetical protein
MPATTVPADQRPPPELGPAGVQLWTDVTTTFEVERHLLPVLAAACNEVDRAADAEAAVAHDGAYISDRYGSLKAHPGVAVARSSRLAAARLLRALSLDPPEPHPGPGRYQRGIVR